MREDAKHTVGPGTFTTSQPGPEPEPIFTLRAQDVLAPAAIDFWATRLESAEKSRFEEAQAEARRSTNWYGPEKFEPSYKVKEARAIAHDMRAWQERNHKKVPD